MENPESATPTNQTEPDSSADKTDARTVNGASGNQGKQKRLPKGSVPPSLTLQEAMDVARRIYELAAGAAPFSASVEITGNKASSSTFNRKLITLRQYGVVSVEDEVMKLTELGQSLVAPKDENEYKDALKRTFLRIDIYFKLYERLKGRPLPQEVYLINMLVEYVPKDLTETWLDKFRRSAMTAGLLEDRDGKLYVLDEPKLPQEPERETPPKPPVEETVIEKPENPPVSARTPIVLGPGRWAYLELPPDWKPKELRKLIKILELALGEETDVSEA